MKKYLFFVLIFLGTHISCDNQQESNKVSLTVDGVDAEISASVEVFDEATVHKIDKFFSHSNKIGRFNGVVLFADGNKVFSKAYGYSNFRSRDSLSVNTSFQLASVSKPVTAIATLMLKEEGKLSLNDSVQKFIPDFPYHGITIEQLLSHRSGLGNYVYWTDKYWKEKFSLMTNDDVLNLTYKHKPGLYQRPNRRYYYNNSNYQLLASIIERASGVSFGEYLQSNIFDPLEMKHSFLYTLDNLETREVATGYKTRRRQYNQSYYLDGVYGDKGLYSSVEDLYKLDIALRDGTLLSDSTIVDAYTNRSKSYRKPYGLGWRIGKYKGQKIIYHHGWWRGFKSYFVRSVEDGKTVIVLSNIIYGTQLNNNLLLNLVSDGSELEAGVDDKELAMK